MLATFLIHEYISIKAIFESENIRNVHKVDISSAIAMSEYSLFSRTVSKVVMVWHWRNDL